MATIPIVAAVKDFDKLTRELAAAKEAAKAAKAEAKGMAAELEKASGGGALGKMAKDAGAFALGLMGVNSAGAIAGKIIAAAKEDFAQLVAMQKGAATAQQTMYEATGALARATNLTPKEVDEWRTFAETHGEQIGKGGAAGIMQARAALGGEMGATPEAVKEQAMARAVTAKAQSPGLDMTQYFTTLMELQDAFAGNVQQADNILIARLQSGAKLATVAKNIDVEKALAAETGAPLEQVMAMSTIMGTELGDEGTGTLRRLMMQGKGGKGGGESSRLKLAAGALKRSEDEIGAMEARFAEAGAPGADFAAEIGRTMAVAPGAAGIAKGKQAAGVAEAAQTADVIGAEWERVRERMKSFEAQYGITTGFDFTKGGREWAGATGEENPLDWERRERAALLGRKLRGITPGEGALASRAAPGAGLSAEESRQAYQGMTEEQMLREAVGRGAVSPAGGISTVESQALQQVGITPETIQEWNRLFLDGLTQKLAEAFATAMQAVNTQPAANALNPGA